MRSTLLKTLHRLKASLAHWSGLEFAARAGSVWKLALPSASQVEQAIRRASTVIVLVTQAAMEVARLRNEISFALDVKRPIIPLLLEANTAPMIEICGLQPITLYKDPAAGVSELIRRVHEPAPAPPASDQTAKPPLPAIPQKSGTVSGTIELRPILLWKRSPCGSVHWQNGCLECHQESCLE